jgi:hypothetical protein
LLSLVDNFTNIFRAALATFFLLQKVGTLNASSEKQLEQFTFKKAAQTSFLQSLVVNFTNISKSKFT